MSKAYRVYNKKTQAIKETIHISFKEKKKDLDQNVHDLEEDMENLSLNKLFLKSTIPSDSHKGKQ